MQELKLPKLGQAMEEGVILEWHCAVGDELEVGDPIVSIESEKTTHDITAEKDGRLLDKRVEAGETVPIGTVLGHVGTESETDQLPDEADTSGDIGDKNASEQNDESPAQDSTSSTEQDSQGSIPTSDTMTGSAPEKIRASPSARKKARSNDVEIDDVGQALGIAQVRPTHVEEYVDAHEDSAAEEIRASPAARRIADEQNVDIQTVGTHLDTTRIRINDVEQYIDEHSHTESTAVSSADESLTAPVGSEPAVRETVEITGGKQVMYDRMQQVSSEYGSTTTIARVDATELINLISSLESSWEQHHDVSPSLTSFVLCAVAQELPDYPMLNAEVVEGEDKPPIARQFSDINLGLAVDTDYGLLVPTIYGADEKSVTELTKSVSDLAKQARERDLDMEQQENGTFTVSNAGTFGAYINTPQINPPQTGILGICTVTKEPAVVDGEIVPRDMMHLSLTYDHRVVEGATSVKFLQAVKNRLEDPKSLLA